MKSNIEKKESAQFEPLDPSFLIDCVNDALEYGNLKRSPNIEWLLNTLKAIDKALIIETEFPTCVVYYFVRPINPNQPGSEWQFKTNINIYGWCDIHFDVLQNGRLGGAEVWSGSYPERLPRSQSVY